MTINELKPGYLVKLRNGEHYMVMNTERGLVLVKDKCGDVNMWLELNKNRMEANGPHTIMEVYGHNHYAHKVFDFSTEDRTLLWRRKEKKQYTYAQLREILGEEFEVIG